MVAFLPFLVFRASKFGSRSDPSVKTFLYERQFVFRTDQWPFAYRRRTKRMEVAWRISSWKAVEHVSLMQLIKKEVTWFIYGPTGSGLGMQSSPAQRGPKQAAKTPRRSRLEKQEEGWDPSSCLQGHRLVLFDILHGSFWKVWRVFAARIHFSRPTAGSFEESEGRNRCRRAQLGDVHRSPIVDVLQNSGGRKGWRFSPGNTSTS